MSQLAQMALVALPAGGSLPEGCSIRLEAVGPPVDPGALDEAFEGLMADLMADADDALDNVDEEWLVPEAGKPVPPELLEPSTLRDAVRRIGMDAQARGDEEGWLAACRVLACLRVGPIMEVADALVEQLRDIE